MSIYIMFFYLFFRSCDGHFSMSICDGENNS